MATAGRGGGRVFQRGSKWWIAYYRRGKEFRESAGITERQARQKLRVRLGEIALGQFVGPQQDRVKVSALLDAYLTNRTLAAKKSLAKITSVVGRLKAHLGDWRAIDVRCRAWSGSSSSSSPPAATPAAR